MDATGKMIMERLMRELREVHADEADARREAVHADARSKGWDGATLAAVLATPRHYLRPRPTDRMKHLEGQRYGIERALRVLQDAGLIDPAPGAQTQRAHACGAPPKLDAWDQAQVAALAELDAVAAAPARPPVALLTDEQRREHAAPYRTPVQRMRDAARSRGPDPDEADAVCADEQRARRKDERRGR